MTPSKKYNYKNRRPPDDVMRHGGKVISYFSPQSLAIMTCGATASLSRLHLVKLNFPSLFFSQNSTSPFLHQYLLSPFSASVYSVTFSVPNISVTFSYWAFNFLSPSAADLMMNIKVDTEPGWPRQPGLICCAAGCGDWRGFSGCPHIVTPTHPSAPLRRHN